MTRPQVIDTFMVNNELDMLECRLVEIGDAVDYVIAVEADVDHQDHPKQFVLSDNIERFAPWKDKLVVVRATGLPTASDDPDPWARELAQREYVAVGLEGFDVQADDIILHGDVDEIPTAVAARNVRPQGFVAFEQRGHFWAVDWLYPKVWCGTVAARARDIQGFGAMRSARNRARGIPGAGWHLSWLGGSEATLAKLGSFCHPEVEQRIRVGLGVDNFYRSGLHVDGEVMEPVDVDSTWPRYIYERRCPDSWFRPR